MTITKIWQAPQTDSGSQADEQEKSLQLKVLSEAAKLLREGGTVAFPTETVYGLGADARSTAAVQRIFTAKGRPSDNPLIVHIARREQMDEFVYPYPPLAKVLMDRFWPGPLTLVLPVKPNVLSPLVTAGLATVGVRMPAHPIALKLIELSGCPIAAPSANRSGRPSPTQASHVLDDLNGRIDGIIDGGAAAVGLESTVIELNGENRLRILRPGGITLEQLQEAVPESTIDGASDLQEDAPRSPGMKYTHYAPEGELELVQGAPKLVSTYIQERINEARGHGEVSGVLAFEERVSHYDADCIQSLGSEADLEAAAHLLYAALRAMDVAGATRIWAEGCSDTGIGAALMNRMMKAAGSRIHYLSE